MFPQVNAQQSSPIFFSRNTSMILVKFQILLVSVRFQVLLTYQNLSNAQFIEAERLAPFNQRGLDVNVLLDLMIHDIDLILHIKGSVSYTHLTLPTICSV